MKIICKNDDHLYVIAVCFCMGEEPRNEICVFYTLTCAGPKVREHCVRLEIMTNAGRAEEAKMCLLHHRATLLGL